ncbi:MAG: hypothetical protein DU481_07660 [Nitrosomonas sp.]|uniref:hypothetical protein n=1 Tax=Nitrosomonas sp. TaxID=42353 RepID=UPI0032ED038B
MDNLSNYLTIKQAKKFLSDKINRKVSKLALLELAARGDIKLCVLFEGNVAEFQYKHPEPIRASAFLFKLKNALIKIPPESINLRGGIVHIIPIEIIEAVINSDYKAAHPYYGGGCENLPRIQPGYFYGAYTSDPENAGKIKFATLEANIDEAVIPTQDLIDYIKDNKFSKQLEPQTTKRENTKTGRNRRNCLDPAIDKAIEMAGNSNTADVYLQLKQLALDEHPPFNGTINNGALCDTNDDDDHAELSRDALAGRLRRRKESIANAK